MATIILISLKKCLNIDFFKKIVNILYSLACGALIGDALIHIVPDAFANDDNNTFFYIHRSDCIFHDSLKNILVFRNCPLALGKLALTWWRTFSGYLT